jgi:hypothetical protein
MEAIGKMCLMPALRLQGRVPAILRKGRILEGADADLTIFDLATVADASTYDDPRPSIPSASGTCWSVVGRSCVRDVSTRHPGPRRPRLYANPSQRSRWSAIHPVAADRLCAHPAALACWAVEVYRRFRRLRFRHQRYERTGRLHSGVGSGRRRRSATWDRDPPRSRG